jgi:hypothetical protein
VNIGYRIYIIKLANVYDSLKMLSYTLQRNNIIDNILFLIINNCIINLFIDAAVIKLVKKLDGLLLALATAGVYLDQVLISFADYLHLYKRLWLRL